MNKIVAFLLTNLNPDFAIENEISCSVNGQTNPNNPPLEVDRSDWYLNWFQIFVPFERIKLGTDQFDHLGFETSNRPFYSCLLSCLAFEW